MFDLSIIVPVYNAAEFIKNTVSALLTQKDIAYEIILVNDGSTDDSASICNELFDQHNNVRCLHVINGGPGKARNLGIETACGDYIAFCDSDDIPVVNMYGKLLETMISNNCDYCLCDIYSERDERNFGFPWEGDQLFEGEQVIDILLASMLGNLNDDDRETPVWGSSIRAIYKKKLLDQYQVRFPEDIRFAEDLVFNVRYLSYCRSAYVLNQILYRYTWNSDSLMNSFIHYNMNMFRERLLLVQYLKDATKLVDEKGTLSGRIQTSARCYFHECVGNAVRAVQENGYGAAFTELKGILGHPIVCSAFKTLSIKNKKKRLIYGLIQKKCALTLMIYYSLRLQ